ncbi:hypothetical protein NS274_21965 [Pseudomonas oryzihabitans]|nr:hypothetical protein NS274_21965 [Pseudomonas psychrotolerans]KTT65203.1 hypothetical protein NS383_11740 [Pseudomonas psychrotolerans]
MHQRPFAIAGREIGPAHPPYCIAEVGINHNGDLDTALRLIEVAKSAGADAVKFQTFKAEEFCGDPLQAFTYTSQGRSVTEPMLEMFRRHEFSPAQWRLIAEHCRDCGITFFSTPQNPSDLELLLRIGVPAVKVGSDDFSNLPLLRHYATTGLPLILSCGMSDLADVHTALETVGWFSGTPVALLLCTSQYPTPDEDVNLAKLSTLQGAFPGLVIGFSDHTRDALAASVAVGRGACIFEKHFTLDRDLPGPDHWFSETPDSLRLWISAIRRSANLLGSPYLRPTTAEADMRVLARRSLVALTDVAVGERFTLGNLGLRRPGDGLSPALYEAVLGSRALRSLTKGERLQLGDFARDGVNAN